MELLLKEATILKVAIWIEEVDRLLNQLKVNPKDIETSTNDLVTKIQKILDTPMFTNQILKGVNPKTEIVRKKFLDQINPAVRTRLEGINKELQPYKITINVDEILGLLDFSNQVY